MPPRLATNVLRPEKTASMTKLLYSSTSPYSAKVRMGAAVAGVKLALEAVDTNVDPAILIDNNPLGKIPTLVTADGTAIFDSRAIMAWLDRAGVTRLYPRNAAKRGEAEVTEALCDGICDCLLAIVYEQRLRPEEKQYRPWIDRQWEKVTRSLDHLEANLPRMGRTPTAAHLAVASLTGYLNLRFEGKWERGRPKLKAFARRFEANFPQLAAMRPKA
jgi:Glutathione S-transferase